MVKPRVRDLAWCPDVYFLLGELPRSNHHCFTTFPTEGVPLLKPFVPLFFFRRLRSTSVFWLWPSSAPGRRRCLPSCGQTSQKGPCSRLILSDQSNPSIVFFFTLRSTLSCTALCTPLLSLGDAMFSRFTDFSCFVKSRNHSSSGPTAVVPSPCLF